MSGTNDQFEKLFDDLLTRNRGRFIAIARSYSDIEWEDLLQEILLKIWRGLPSLNDESRIDTWCYRVALNSAISWSRKNKKNGEERLCSPIADSKQTRISEVELLRQFLKQLSELDKAILLMYLDDFSYEKISDVTGMKIGTIRVRLHRIKTKLELWEEV